MILYCCCSLVKKLSVRINKRSMIREEKGRARSDPPQGLSGIGFKFKHETRRICTISPTCGTALARGNTPFTSYAARYQRREREQQANKERRCCICRKHGYMSAGKCVAFMTRVTLTTHDVRWISKQNVRAHTSVWTAIEGVPLADESEASPNQRRTLESQSNGPA